MDKTELPGFLYNLELPVNKLKIELKCKKISDKINNSYIIFSLTISVGNLFIILI
jgi:hypothetical protein